MGMDTFVSLPVMTRSDQKEGTPFTRSTGTPLRYTDTASPTTGLVPSWSRIRSTSSLRLFEACDSISAGYAADLRHVAGVRLKCVQPIGRLVIRDIDGIKQLRRLPDVRRRGWSITYLDYA